MASLNKAQRKIVIAAAVLIIIAFSFPPYKDCTFNEKGEWIGKCHIEWAFNKSLRDASRDLISGIKGLFSSTMTFDSIYINYPLMRRLLWAEISGILVLAGAALLITKKR